MKPLRLPTITKKYTDNKLKLVLWAMPVLTLAIIALSYSSLPEKIPLYYSLPWGKYQLADKVWLFLVPVVVVLFNLINAIVSKIFQKIIDDYLTSALVLSGLLCNLLAAITVLQIIRIMI